MLQLRHHQLIKRVLAAVLIFTATSALASIAYVGGATHLSTGLNTNTVTYAATAGNAVRISYDMQTNQGTIYCLDNNGYPYLAGPIVIGTTGISTVTGMYVFYGLVPANTTSFTCYSFNTGASTVSVDEYSGVTDFNAFLSGASGTGSTSSLSGSVTTEDANDWFTFGVTGGANSTTAVGPNQRTVQNTSTPKLTTGDTGVVTSPGATSFTATFSGNKYVYSGVELKTVAVSRTFTLRQLISDIGWAGQGWPDSTPTYTFALRPDGIVGGAQDVVAAGVQTNIDSSGPLPETLTSISDCPTSTCDQAHTINPLCVGTVTVNTTGCWVLSSMTGAKSCAGGVVTAGHTGYVDCAWINQPIGGAKFISMTTSNNNTLSRGGAVAEYTLSAGKTAVLDDAQVFSDVNSVQTETIVSTTVTGTDAIFQNIYNAGTNVDSSGPCYNGTWARSHFYWFVALDQVSNPGCLFTSQSPTFGPWAGAALAFKAVAPAVAASQSLWWSR